MADLYPTIQYPQIDFSPLGRLPQTMEEARIRQARQSLGDLEKLSPEELIKKGNQLIGRGDLEGGIRVRKAGLDELEYLRKKAEGEQYLKIAPLLFGAAGRGAPEEPAPAPTPEPTRPPPQPPQPPPPDPFAGAVNPLAPPPAPPPALRQSAAPPSPSEEILAAAEGGGAPVPPRGPQLAGPPNVSVGPVQVNPDLGPNVAVTDPTQQGFGQLPPWMQGAQARPMTIAPPASPAPPAAAARPAPAGTPPKVPTFSEDLAELRTVERLMAVTPPHASPTQTSMLRQRYLSVLDRIKLSENQKEWRALNLERWMNNQQPQSYDEFLTLKGGARQRLHEEMVKESDVHTTRAEKASNLKADLDTLQAIAEDPRFVSGFGQEETAQIISAGSGLKDLALALGVPKDVIESIGEKIGAGKDFNKMTDIAKLQEVFRAISNNAVYSKLGSLGSNISNSDRTFVTSAFPSLALTRAGNQMLLKVMQALTAHNIELGRQVDQWRATHELSGRAPELREMVRKFRENSNIFRDALTGELTPLGQAVEEAKKAPPDITAPPTVLSPPVGPTGGSPGGLPEQAAGPYSYPSGAFRGPGGVGGRVGIEGLPFRARGGPVAKGKPVVVGERGPEAFVSDRKIMPHHEGKVFFDEKTGRPAGRIRGGKPHHFGKR